MDLLTIRHKDFVLSIECSKWEGIWTKAVNNVKEENLYSQYSWSEDVESVVLSVDGAESELKNGEKERAIFFDNAEYPVWVEFNDYVKDARFGSMLKSENENFSFRRQILAGFLNYGNEIGRSEILIDYKVGDVWRHFKFGFEVLSTKLNYHEHWRQILEDIEQEYRMLSLDYMKRTFHGFSPDANGEQPDIVWWSIFSREQAKFINAVKSIIERPRHRLHSRESYVRADKLKRVPVGIENELAEHRKEPAHLYRIEEQIQSNDTQENRFLKHALRQIADKYEALEKRIETLNNLAPERMAEMKSMLKTMRHLQRNPFFRTVGRFKGLSQESLVLQKATGYSQVYRTWNLLRRAYSLNDGMYRLQTKDIATLYEIWCFIEVSHIVKELLGLGNDDVEHNNRMEMNGLFTWELGKGEHSRILFKKGDVELAELVYNPKHTDKENDNISISNLVVPTVPQKPDIVLQLTKNDLQKDMKMTYLFDAKYRIEGKVNGVDTPPDDAINQMHRYRDAIYYQEYSGEALKKEVIGGYILFPGDGERTKVEVSKFYKSIDQVNIGAFPLRPKDEENRKLLVEFIDGLIHLQSTEILEEVLPQKGVVVDVPNRVLVGYVKNFVKTQEVENHCLELYYTGKKFPTTIPLHDLHYFAPYIKGKGIRDVYEIIQIRTVASKEVKDDEDTDDLRLAFHLQNPRALFEEYRMVELDVVRTFRDTTFEELKGLS